MTETLITPRVLREYALAADGVIGPTRTKAVP